MPQFIVLMTEDDGAWARLSDAAQAALLAKYDTWFADLESLSERPVASPTRPKRDRQVPAESARRGL